MRPKMFKENHYSELDKIHFLFTAHAIIHQSIEKIGAPLVIANAFYAMYYINLCLPYNVKNKEHNFNIDFNFLLEIAKDIPPWLLREISDVFFSLLTTIHHILVSKNPEETNEKEERETLFRELVNSTDGIENQEALDFQDAFNNYDSDMNSCFSFNLLEDFEKDLVQIEHDYTTYLGHELSFSPILTDISRLSRKHSFDEIAAPIRKKYADKFNIENIESVVLSLYNKDYSFPRLLRHNFENFFEKLIKSIDLNDILQHTAKELISFLDDSLETNIFSNSFLFRYILVSVPSEHRDQMKLLLNKIKNTNKKAKEEYKVNCEFFVYKHHLKIIQLVNIMGEKGIKYLSSFLANSVLKLEREIEQICLFSLKSEKQLSRLFKALTTENYDEEYIKNFLACLKCATLFMYDKNYNFITDKDLTLLYRLFEEITNKEIFYWENNCEKYSKQEIQEIIFQYRGEELSNKTISNPIINILEFLILAVSNQLLDKRKQQCHIPKRELLKILKEVPLNKFVNLFSATEHMKKNSEYKTIYLKMLESDLFKRNIDTILHDIEQEDLACKQLAKHNSNINEILEKHKLYPKNLFSYPKKLTIKFLQNNSEQVEEGKLKCYENLYSHLGQLSTKITEILGSFEKRVSNLEETLKEWGQKYPTEHQLFIEFLNHNNDTLTAISPQMPLKEAVKAYMLLKEMDRAPDDIEQILKRFMESRNERNEETEFNLLDFYKKQTLKNDKDLSAINEEIARLSKMANKRKSGPNNKKNMLANSISIKIAEYKNENKDIPNAIKEFMTHVLETQQEIKNINSNVRKKISTVETFTIKQWDKKNEKTFFLGDEVGCCLATTNAQFHAMVQRRMDDAMFFHVAINNETGKVAALVWLYLAITDNNEIVVVANFFEVATKFALNQDLRIALLNGLLKFTNDYCYENNNIQFYMNQLPYGWNQKDLKDYNLVELNIKNKVGGALVLDEGKSRPIENPKEVTEKLYYLTSLRNTKFHKFESEKLNFQNLVIIENEEKNNILEFSPSLKDNSSKNKIFITSNSPYLLFNSKSNNKEEVLVDCTHFNVSDPETSFNI